MGVFVPFLIGSQMLLVTVADGTPSLNVTETCRAAGSVSGSTPSQNDIDACRRDEQEARAAIAKQWGKYSADSKARCVRTSKDYLPSYVELQSCLEMAKDAASSPEEKESKTQQSSPPRQRAARRNLRDSGSACLPWDYTCTSRYNSGWDSTPGSDLKP